MFNELTEFALLSEEYDEARAIAGLMRSCKDEHPEDAEGLAGFVMKSALREAKTIWAEEARLGL